MATYNWSSVLPYSIGSALRQTFPDFELLVVGDGCTDDSEAVVKGMGDSRVRRDAPFQGPVGETESMLPGAIKDGQQVTNEWQQVGQRIDGVVTREVLHVPRDHGIITETFRPEWDPTGAPVVHVYQSRLFPGAIGAWSCHMRTIDRLFVNQCHLKVVLYDGREDSRTSGRLMELHVGDARPTFLMIPIGVWHGLQNRGTNDALVLNYPTHAYDYEDPDHYRLPFDSPEIPYDWGVSEGARLRADSRR